MAAKLQGFARYYIAPKLGFKKVRAWSICLRYLDGVGYSPPYLTECDGYTWEPARLAWADYCDMKLLEEQAANGIL